MELQEGSGFARDPNHAENAGQVTMHGARDSKLVDTKLQAAHSTTSPKQDPSPNISKSGFKTSFRTDAKIWELYLDDAERVAKERVELWKTWLDSLLIFAGLFAGVLASFVVDATDDSNGNGPSLPPSTRSLWTTGLWCCSLMITIFGAIMGVLAKAWISNFIPVSNRREAKDAHQRLMLDKQAERWHLERVILVIPLLVQIASLLFAFGFAIKLFDTNIKIGTVVAILVGIGVLAYLFGTVTAMLSPQSFPFRTPLSDLLLFLKNLRNLVGSNKTEGHKARSQDDELAEIWLEKLIKSPNVSTVNEAIAELARQWNKIGDQRPDYFCQPDVLRILLRRQKDYMTPESYYKTEAREELCFHMECLMKITQHIELKPKLTGNLLLREILSEYLKPGGPLHRWNVFQEDVRPLALSARTHVMVFLNETLSEGSLVNRDVTSAEVGEQPWESIFYNVRGNHRFKLMLSSCRGLVEGQRSTQIVSSGILSLFLAQASVRGLSSESSADVQYDMLCTAESYAWNYLKKLAERTVEQWESVMNDTTILLEGSELSNIFSPAI